MYFSLPGSSVRGILQARILEWVAIPFSRGVRLHGSLDSSCDNKEVTLGRDRLPALICSHFLGPGRICRLAALGMWIEEDGNRESAMGVLLLEAVRRYPGQRAAV